MAETDERREIYELKAKRIFILHILQSSSIVLLLKIGLVPVLLWNFLILVLCNYVHMEMVELILVG